MWRPDDPQGRETAKIRFELVPYTRGRGLDVGCGPEKAFPHMWGVDSNIDEKLFGIRADGADLIVPTAVKLDMFGDGSMDYVYSSHTLEHIQDHKACLREWWRLVKPEGYLILYLPHKELYPNIGTPMANPDHKHDFWPQDIIAAMKEMPGTWDLVRNEDRNEAHEYSFFQVYWKVAVGSGHEESWKTYPDPKKTCAVVRFGAYGDMLQSASVFPGLKAAGWHVRVYTSHMGYEVCKHDPNVDSWVVQDQDQVPNEWLSPFFKWMEWNYGKVVNLCGIVEERLLPAPKDHHYHWPKEARHSLCDHNYVEMQHRVAGVPYTKPATQFYSTLEEKIKAGDRKRQAKGKVILFSLSGSSVNKVWPYLDALMARLLLADPLITIVLVGGPGDQMLERGWENEPRVWKRAGVWSIREAMSFARISDVVIGAETGVLNAVAMEEVPKLLFLSHSTVENLCRDWVNTCAFTGAAPCYPCHRLHYSFEFCTRGKAGGTGVSNRDDPERGVALCQELIDPDSVWGVLATLLKVEVNHGKRLQVA